MTDKSVIPLLRQTIPNQRYYAFIGDHTNFVRDNKESNRVARPTSSASRGSDSICESSFSCLANTERYMKSQQHIMLGQVLSVAKTIGYSDSIQRFIIKELRKDLTDARASKCKKCGRKIYRVVLQSYVNHLPRKKRICSQCANLSDDFEPQCDFDTAWKKNVKV